ncbi:MAG: TIGR02452 family protein [Chloroflexi bacterium]|nr:MAG: TIGR02452 family protein [Chloroflexota bacterium]
MTSRKTRALVAQETIEIIEQGWYLSPEGQKVTIAELLRYARENSVLYRPADFDEVFSMRDHILRNTSGHPSTEFAVVNSTTLSAASELVHRRHASDVLCLNFASARNPGGGFLRGSQAQEESLARASGLYPCIVQMKAMYHTNRRFRSCLYTDHMIYSPKVPVFRDDTDVLLREPYCVSIITAPAVNAGAVRRNEKHNIPKIETTMLSRIEKVLSLAVIHHHRTLVLGAWGCGVFKNNPIDVARWFHAHLVENQTFRGSFRTVVFAVLDKSKDQRFMRPFLDTFANLAGGS